MHAIKSGTGAELLGFGFSGGDEEESYGGGRDQRGGDRRGGRGGRGGNRDGAGRGGAGRG